MKRNKVISVIAAGLILIGGSAQAGNEDRAGAAGSTELLINPWGRSSAWASAGISSTTGLESMFVNPAGLAFTEKTDIGFAYTNWLGGSGYRHKLQLAWLKEREIKVLLDSL